MEAVIKFIIFLGAMAMPDQQGVIIIKEKTMIVFDTEWDIEYIDKKNIKLETVGDVIHKGMFHLRHKETGTKATLAIQGELVLFNIADQKNYRMIQVVHDTKLYKKHKIEL